MIPCSPHAARTASTKGGSPWRPPLLAPHSTTTAPSARPRHAFTCRVFTFHADGTVLLRSGTTTSFSGTTFTFSDADRARQGYHSGTTFRYHSIHNYSELIALRFPNSCPFVSFV